MPKRHGELFAQITDMSNLRLAYLKTRKGKKSTVGYLRFKEYAEYNLLQIQQELQDGTYRLMPSRKFTVYEPKERHIEALEFRDRLAQHALCNIITPIFERTFLPNSYACREGMGTHAGVKFVQSQLRKGRHTHFLKTDFSKYFASIDINILMREVERKVKCGRTLQLLRTMLGGGVGVKIGWLTSQLAANIYGNMLDRHLFYTLGLRAWARYMDDVVVLGHSKDELLCIKAEIEGFALRHMGLKLSKWQVSTVDRGINFLGYRIWATHKLIRKDSVSRAKKKIKRYTKSNDAVALSKFKAAWLGHIRWSNAHNLKVKLNLET